MLAMVAMRGRREGREMRNANFNLLDDTEHMFRWIFPDPHNDIWEQVEITLNAGVDKLSLERLYITSGPEWLVNTVPKEDNPDKGILSAAAFAFEVDVEVSASEVKSGKGIFSFAFVGFGKPIDERHYKSWFDADGSLAQYGSQGELADRFRLIKQRN